MTAAERLRLRCRQSPAWAAAEIERLRSIVWLHVDLGVVAPELVMSCVPSDPDPDTKE